MTPRFGNYPAGHFPEPPGCGAKCPRNRFATCEIPAYLHRPESDPLFTEHLGQDRFGRWFSWPVAYKRESS